MAYMGVEHDNDPPDPDADVNGLAPGVWVIEATGFASVPPRAQSDLCSGKDDNDKQQDSQGKGADDPSEPRIERYRER